MELSDDQWNIGHLRGHLQAAAELEAWTIPYYMAAMFSVVDRSTPAYQLIQTVVHQEMLHLQLVANVANAFGHSPTFNAGTFPYQGTAIPHLDFALDPDNPAHMFTPYSAEIGPLDEERINAMCLIEYPEWKSGGKPTYRDDITEYGSIGEFYDAVEYGAAQLAGDIVGAVRQVDLFAAFYRRLPKLTVDATGAGGFPQVALLIDVIRDQGEAAKGLDDIAVPFRNTADDSEPQASHYEKFGQIRAQPLPSTYPVKAPAEYTAQDGKRLEILLHNFARFMSVLGHLFSGRSPDGFVQLMVTIGGNILACWQSGVTPRFTVDPPPTRSGHVLEP